MSSSRGHDAASRYVAWLRHHLGSVIAGSLALLALSIYLVVFHLPLHADFSHLLPQDAPAVRDLRRLEARVSAQDTALVVVVAPDAAARATAVGAVVARLQALPPSLIDHIEHDDRAVRDFLRQHRHLFVPLPDLERALRALRTRIERAKLEANPLFIDLDEEPDAEAKAAEAELRALRDRRREAEARLDRSSYVSADGKTGLIVVRTSFAKTDVASGKQLVAALARARDEVEATMPGVDIGFTGGVINSAAEHEALFRGMILSSIVTAVLVGLVLVLYFRSIVLLVLLGFALIVGTTAAFGAAALTVGHLNAATAFLGAIIAGNGVNYGILLLARFLEERRETSAPEAMATAVHRTLRPTIVASLGAAIAYGSLAATSFRGFADFAVIGAIGMVLCWIATFVILPPLVLRFVAHPRLPPGDPVLGRILSGLLGFRRPAVVCAVATALTIAALAVTYRYVADDPFEYDIKNLRSEGADAIESRRWLAISDRTFGRGISGQTYIAADDLAQIPLIVAALERIDRDTIGVVRSILDLVPEHQADKLRVLGEIRTLLSDDALETLPEDDRGKAESAGGGGPAAETDRPGGAGGSAPRGIDRREIDALRPPEDLREITIASLPEEIADRLRERDGRVGYLIGVRPALELDEWNGRDLIRFAQAIRRIDLGDGETVTTSGPSVIFADIVQSVQGDGPLVTLVAALGLTLMVLVVVGRNMRAVAVMAATLLGSLGLVAVCALVGIKVNFLDFVALPITLGLGVDYAINVAHRHHHEEEHDARETLRTSGSAVFLCSLTTIIGYGSLLVSDNLAIRGFGEAALIGEVSCLLTALVLVPALLSVTARQPPRGVTPDVALGGEPPLARP